MNPSGAPLDRSPTSAALAAVEARCFDRPWNEADYDAFRKNVHIQAWSLRGPGGAPIAFLLGQLLAGEGELLRIGVLPERRGAGWGHELLARWVGHCRQEGAGRLLLEVRAGNEAAIRLYRGAGFEPFSRRPAYFKEPLEDALLFRCELTAGAEARGAE